MEGYGIRGQLLDNVRALYKDSKCMVRTRSGQSKWFPVTSGVRQGCVLSPLLFLIYMDKIAKEANPTSGEINELLFADDQSLIHKDSAGLQDHTNKLNAACEKYGMKVSIAKTETMVCQTWTLNKRTTQKLITCEMRCLRRAANKSRRDKIRNEDIRKMVGTTPITEYVAKQQVRWFGHFMRMAPSQPASRTYNSKTTGTRARGRPRKRWADGVKEVLASYGIPMSEAPSEATRLAQERKLHFPTTL
ncbi:uncharacterized protein [Amphiura filiformis]|uniref:uncharacterized protein n=1 Tax=Amphiura filiformis TaxID=82378 RepID=UPI003B20C1CE